DGAHNHAVDAGRAAPVVFVRLQHHFHAAVPADELVWAGADGGGGEGVGVALRVRRLDHLHPVHAGRQNGVGAVGDDLHGVVVYLHRVGDGGEERQLLRVQLGVDDALDAVHHRIGVERLAVVV